MLLVLAWTLVRQNFSGDKSGTAQDTIVNHVIVGRERNGYPRMAANVIYALLRLGARSIWHGCHILVQISVAKPAHRHCAECANVVGQLLLMRVQYPGRIYSNS